MKLEVFLLAEMSVLCMNRIGSQEDSVLLPAAVSVLCMNTISYMKTGCFFLLQFPCSV